MPANEIRVWALIDANGNALYSSNDRELVVADYEERIAKDERLRRVLRIEERTLQFLLEDCHCDLELAAALEKRLQLMPVDALIDSSNSQIRLQTQLLKVADLVQLDPTHFLDALDHGPVTAETVIS